MSIQTTHFLSLSNPAISYVVVFFRNLHHPSSTVKLSQQKDPAGTKKAFAILLFLSPFTPSSRHEESSPRNQERDKDKYREREREVADCFRVGFLILTLVSRYERARAHLSRFERVRASVKRTATGESDERTLIAKSRSCAVFSRATSFFPHGLSLRESRLAGFHFPPRTPAQEVREIFGRRFQRVRRSLPLFRRCVVSEFCFHRGCRKKELLR